MKKNKFLLLLIALLLSLNLAVLVFADVLPGSEEDPLISQSYVDSLIESLNQKIESLENKENEIPSFVVVEVEADKKLLGGEGCEMILRAGNAIALDNGVDGICDLTDGCDLKGGTTLTKNHLLLIPRNDGRGMYCSNKCYVMVKGDYTIE